MRERHVVMLLRNPYTHDSRVEKEAATLRGAGYRVTVVADLAPGLPDREERDGVEVLRVARRGPRVPGASFLLHQWRLTRRLVDLRPDILHAHDSDALIPVGLAARRLRRPYVYDAHELWLHRPRRQRSRLYNALQRTFYRIVQRTFVPRAAAVLTVSKPIARHLATQYRLAHVELVPNYPDLEPGGAERGELRALPGMEDVPASAPIVLYLGGLMEERGIESLVRAMADVPGAYLVLLGSGGHAAALLGEAERAGVGDRVRHLSPVPPGEVIAYAASATIGVSPTVPTGLNNQYSLPNKLFQYMAAGIPVLASDFPQIREIVVGSGAGLVADTQRPARIAGALQQLLADPDQARHMGERGEAAIRAKYNWSTSAIAFLDAYSRVEADRLRRLRSAAAD